MDRKCIIARPLALLGAAVLLFSAVGCGRQTGPDGSAPNSGTSQVPTAPDDPQSSAGTLPTDSDAENTTGTGTAGTGKTTKPPAKTTAAKTTSGKTQSDKTQQAKDALDFGGKTVTLIYEWKPQTKKGVSAATDRWIDRVAEVEKKFNCKIEQKQGTSNTEYNGNIVTSVLNGSPVGHIISINGNANYNFIRSGIVASLDAAIKQTGIDMTDARYNQTIRQYYHVNGSQYVFGYTTFGDTTRDVSGLWAYNKRIMNAIKVDPYALYQSGNWTWQKVSEIAKAATVRNSSGTVTQYGLGISGAMSVLIQLSLANGGRLGTVDSSGSSKITLDTPNNREAFEQLYQWGSVDKTVLGNAGDMAWNAIDKEFAKGNIAILAGGAALVNICYEQGMKDEIGIVPVPKGPRATGYVSQMNIGYGYFIPVTYQKDAAKYLMLMDELYMPYEGVSQDTLFKERWISRFTDANAYKLFKSMYTDTAHQVTDMLSLFDVSWGDPAFSTVAGNVMRGTITPGNAIDTYADTYQTVVNDKFDGYKITGIKNGG